MKRSNEREGEAPGEVEEERRAQTRKRRMEGLGNGW